MAAFRPRDRVQRTRWRRLQLRRQRQRGAPCQYPRRVIIIRICPRSWRARPFPAAPRAPSVNALRNPSCPASATAGRSHRSPAMPATAPVGRQIAGPRACAAASGSSTTKAVAAIVAPCLPAHPGGDGERQRIDLLAAFEPRRRSARAGAAAASASRPSRSGGCGGGAPDWRSAPSRRRDRRRCRARAAATSVASRLVPQRFDEAPAGGQARRTGGRTRSRPARRDRRCAECAPLSRRSLASSQGATVVGELDAERLRNPAARRRSDPRSPIGVKGSVLTIARSATPIRPASAAMSASSVAGTMRSTIVCGKGAFGRDPVAQVGVVRRPAPAPLRAAARHYAARLSQRDRGEGLEPAARRSRGGDDEAGRGLGCPGLEIGGEIGIVVDQRARRRIELIAFLGDGERDDVRFRRRHARRPARPDPRARPARPGPRRSAGSLVLAVAHDEGVEPVLRRHRIAHARASAARRRACPSADRRVERGSKTTAWCARWKAPMPRWTTPVLTWLRS